MSDFKEHRFEGEVVRWAVRWYCRYVVSSRDFEQMMGELQEWDKPDGINKSKAPT